MKAAVVELLSHMNSKQVFMAQKMMEMRCQKKKRLLSTPMGIDYVVIGFDMKVQPLVTHSAA